MTDFSQFFIILFALANKNVGGDKLLLSPYIEQGELDKARELSRVRELSPHGVESYSGLLTVEKDCNSHLFFWFFPAAYGSAEAPLILWHGGGPGSSGMTGLFVQNGPFIIDEGGKLHLRSNAWTLSRSIIYMDSPVGTGFSETDDRAECRITSAFDAGRHVYIALRQFLQLFPQLQPNPLFIFTGSYGGKFGPAIAHEIHLHNGQGRGELIVNLRGLFVNSGFFDPISQIDYGEFYYNMGLIDRIERDYFIGKEVEAKDCIRTGNWSGAFDIIEPLIIGAYGSESRLKNTTGLDFIYNCLKNYKETPSFMDNHVAYLNRADVQDQLHVRRNFSSSNSNVYLDFKQDIYQSVKNTVEELLDTGLYRILISSAQLDLVVPHTTVSKFADGLDWTGRSGWRSQRMRKWLTDSGLIGGYAKVQGPLGYLYMRNTGHIWIQDQPEWAYTLMWRFTEGMDLFEGPNPNTNSENNGSQVLNSRSSFYPESQMEMEKPSSPPS